MFDPRVCAPVALALTLMVVACESSTEPDAAVPVEDLAEIVLDTDDELAGILTEQGQPAPPANDLLPPSAEVIITDAAFSRIRDCPVAGQVVWTATAHREVDTDTGVMTGTFSGTRDKNGCQVERGGFTFTVDGEATWTHGRRRVDGVLDGLQTSTFAGTFDAWRSDGGQRSCSFDVTIVRDTDAGTATITGTICDEVVDRVRDWTPGA